MAYDAEGRIISFASPGGTNAVNFAYDGNGRCVKKQTNKATTIYVYNAFGDLSAEYGPSSSNCTLCYVAKDHLGSTRMVTDGAGKVMELTDYYPFGEQIPASNDSAMRASVVDAGTPTHLALQSLRHKFTGKERDAETGLDVFEARYYSAKMGRFTSADAPFADQSVAMPQSWNLYAYTSNNPLICIDPSGRNWFSSSIFTGSYKPPAAKEVGGYLGFPGAAVDISNGNPFVLGFISTCQSSSITHVVTYTKVGANRAGAAISILALYGNEGEKVAEDRSAFSDHPLSRDNPKIPVPYGEYSILLNVVDAEPGRHVKLKSGPIPTKGMERITLYPFTWKEAWGTRRIRLNEPIGRLNHPDYVNICIDGGLSEYASTTHGCMCNRFENVMQRLFDLADKTPEAKVPVVVRSRTR